MNRSTTPLRLLAALTVAAGIAWVAPTATAVEDCPMVAGTITVTQCRDTAGNTAAPDDGADDSKAIQHAIDTARAAGGGSVFFPAGNYDAAGIIHRSGVRLHGPDGAQPTAKITRIASNDKDLIAGETYGTHGSISAGSTKLTVREAVGIDVGDVITIRGAETPSPNQRSKLATKLASGSGQAFKVTNGLGFSPYGGFLQIGSEILDVLPTTQNSTAMTTANRARYGTKMPSSHPVGTAVAQVRALYAQVTAVSGTVITIDRPAKQTVATAPVTTGAKDVTVEDLELDGSRPSPTVLPASPLNYVQARNVRVKDCVIRNAHHGGVHFQRGTNSSTIENCTFLDIGTLRSASGADIWIFQSAHNNTIRNNTFANSDPSVGSSDNGIWLDDRTTGATEWDGDVHHNVIENNRFELNDAGLPPLTVVGVSGGTYNTIRNNTINVAYTTSSTYGVRVISDYTQSAEPVISAYNTVSGNLMTMLVRAVWLYRANSNTVSGNTMWWAYTKCVNEGSGNVFVNNVTDDYSC